MNLDDESLLSAYLDGELDAEGRSAVEAALLSDAGLSDRLRELSAVRDLIAGLPRPAPRRTWRMRSSSGSAAAGPAAAGTPGPPPWRGSASRRRSSSPCRSA